MGGRPENPVLSYLDDTLARQVAILHALSDLSAFIDEPEALKLALSIQALALEQRAETIPWRKRTKEFVR